MPDHLERTLPGRLAQLGQPDGSRVAADPGGCGNAGLSAAACGRAYTGLFGVWWSGYSCAVEIWKIVVKNNTCIPANNYYNNY